MGIKVKAIERNIKFNGSNDKWAYVMQPEIYGQLGQDKVIEQASLNSGMPKPAMRAAIDAYGAVVKTWATEGHSIPVPGLGTMRFGVRSTAVEDVKEVSSSLITSRRVIFTPSTDIKKALAETAVSITCYDRNGNVVKTVTSEDKDDVEDTSDNNDSQSGSSASGSQSGSSTQQGGSTTGGSDTDYE